MSETSQIIVDESSTLPDEVYENLNPVGGKLTVLSLPPPLVTVVIPCYNYGNVVGRAIQSVKEQKLCNFECFIVDDGSTDNTKDAILNAIKDDLRFHYVHQENAGVANARNKGVFSGNAPYVCCLDADDAIAPEFLEVCVTALEKDPSLGIAYTGLFYIKPDGKRGLSPWPGQYSYDDFLKGQNQIPTCNVSRREIWERLGGQRQRYAPQGAGEEDAELWLRAGAYGWRAEKVTNAGLFIYSWMSGRVSGNREHRMVDFRAWHPWTGDKKHPFASMARPDKHSHPVRQYDEPSVSVIIPVGPGHEKTVMDALDSLEAQTFRGWEAIVVWDNEASPSFINRAFPFARFAPLPYNNGEHFGAGYSRNRGAEIARAPLLLFLDADDWLVPEALMNMIEAYAAEKSIVYSDYVGKSFLEPDFAKQYGERLLEYDEKTKHAVVRYFSANYNCERAVIQPYPNEKGMPYLWNLITSLVPKEWHDEIGGFDEDMSSWEDWDYWIRMAKAGKCFTRIPEIMVVYRFYTGNRREVGIQDHADLIQYLRKKYEGIKTMPCSSCGKKIYQATRTSPPVAVPQSTRVERTSEMNDTDYLLVLYDHPNKGSHRVVGPTTGRDYGYRSGGSDKFLVHKADIASNPSVFKVIDAKPIAGQQDEVVEAPPPQPIVVPKQDEAPHVEQEEKLPAPVQERPFDLQTIPGVTPLIAQQLNAAGIHTLEELADVSDEQLQKMKGIGPARAAAILNHARSTIKADA